jgi:DNA processing protein
VERSSEFDPRPEDEPELDRRLPRDRDALPPLEIQLFATQVMITRGLNATMVGRLIADLHFLGPNGILASSTDDAELRYGIQPQLFERLRANQSDAHRTLQELGDRQIFVLVAGWGAYPSQLTGVLAEQAPAVLFGQGPLDVLYEVGVGFCGSRSSSERAIEIVGACAAVLARAHINVVSGYARGADEAAHRGAIAAGGLTTAVLAEGILRWHPRSDVTPQGYDDVLILSQFAPRLPWNVGNAMTRNWTICALADAMVIAESQLKGGTFAAGQAALKIGRPLYVIDFADSSTRAPGNEYFIQHGAKPLRQRKGGGPNMQSVIAAARLQAVSDERRASRENTVLAAYRKHMTSDRVVPVGRLL